MMQLRISRVTYCEILAAIPKFANANLGSNSVGTASNMLLSIFNNFLFILHSSTSASFCTAGCTLEQVSLCVALDNGIIFDPEM